MSRVLTPPAPKLEDVEPVAPGEVAVVCGRYEFPEDAVCMAGVMLCENAEVLAPSAAG